MSQIIRKLQNGDKAPEVKQARLFKDGNRDIDLDVLIKGANKNIDQYLQSKNWSRKKKQAFMDAYSDIMNSLNSGAIAQRGVDRKYTDTTGRIQNSQGKGFDAYGEAAHFLDTIVDIVPDYQKEKPKEKTKYDANGLINTFKNKFFGGSDPDAIIWQSRDTKDEKTGKYGTSQRASAFAQMLDDYAASLADSDYNYEGTAFKDKNDLVARLQAAASQLRDGTFDNNDYSALTALGIPGKTARVLFSVDALEEAGKDDKDKTKSDDPELAAAEEGLAQAEKNKERQQKINEWKKLQERQRLSDELSRKWYEPAKNFQDQVIKLPTVTLNMDKWVNSLRNKVIANQYYKNFQKLFTQYDPYTHQSMMIDTLTRDKDGNRVSVNYLQHIANNLSYLDQMGLLKDSGIDGYKYYPDTIDEKTGTVVLYNPSTNTYMKSAVFKVPALRDLLLNQNADNDNPFVMKHGGVVAFQFGGQTDYGTAFENYVNLRNSQKKAAEDDKIKERAKSSGRDEKTQKARDTKLSDKGLDSIDVARISSAVLDLGSIGTSFIPVAGTVASGVTGLASTFTNFGADWAEDGLDSQDWKNFATNLGLDLVGLLPGVGAAGKAGKIAKTLGKTLPKVIGLLSTMSVVQQSPEILESFKKLTTGDFKNITTGDLQNIGTGLAAIAAGSRSINSARQIKAYKKAAATGKNNIKLEDGRVVAITDDQLKEIKKAKNLEEANKAIQKATGDKTATLSSTFRGGNPFKAKFYSLKGNPTTGTEYNFNVTDNTGRKFGESGRGGRSLDEWFYKWKTGQDRTAAPDWWNNWVNSVNGKIGDGFKYNIYGRPQSSQSATTKIAGQLPTSRRIRLREKGISDEELNRRGIYKQGGIIKAESGSPLYNRSRYGDGFLTNWASLVTTPVTAATVDGKKNTYGKVGKAKGYTFNTTSRLNTVLDLLGRGKMTNNDVSMLQRRHAGMYAGYNPSLSPVYNEQVKQYQTDWNSLGLNQSIIAPGYNANYDIASKKPISGDSGASNWKSDGRYDQITDDRRILARKEDYYTNGVLDQAKLDADIAAAKAKGYDYYLDPGSNYYMLRKIEPAPQPTAQQTQSKPQQPQQTRNTQLQGLQGDKPTKAGTWLSVFIDQAPNFLAAGRLAGNIANNNRVTAEVKKGLKPLIEDTYNLQRRVQGDLATRQAYYTKAAELENLASRPMTSDASLQLAGQLEAKSKGNQYRTQGDLADNQAIRESAEKAWQVQADNTARRSAVANANRARILQNNAALHNLEAGRMSANWQSIDNFLKQREYDWRTKRNQQRQFDLRVIKDYLSNKYSETPQMEALRKQILDKADKNEDYSDLYSQYLRLKQDQNTQFTNDYNNAYARIYGLRFNGLTPTYRPFLKDGGKIEVARIKAKTESAKLFQENIKESVRNNIKMIDNLSRVTKELILKSMSL